MLTRPGKSEAKASCYEAEAEKNYEAEAGYYEAETEARNTTYESSNVKFINTKKSWQS